MKCFLSRAHCGLVWSADCCWATLDEHKSIVSSWLGGGGRGGYHYVALVRQIRLDADVHIYVWRLPSYMMTSPFVQEDESGISSEEKITLLDLLSIARQIAVGMVCVNCANSMTPT